ncbi:MAG: TlpA disulfide reductase family protein [Thermoleophilia bacterium]|jgi:thiol-disulfide isomerase/thioredoxin
MSRRGKSILVALIAVGVVCLGIGLYGITQQSDTTAAPTEGSLIPAFEQGPAPAVVGTTLTGEPFDLATYRGTPVILNFWASWCAPCRKELPAIAAFAKAHPEIAVVGVSYQDSVKDATAFAKERGVTWPSVVDDGPIGAAYKVPGLPATFLIDAQGQLVDRILGEVTEATLDAHVKELTA